ncbi:DUF441 domain-containing protein [Enterococcus mundtii]|uniref:DUF441 domain-containing protein n=1 Tax=Enterococcus mundtii TaxID=53346 RepID=UPI001CCDE9B4|nr:DUF441 domain-containing protein [Enterococcus mundtii]UBM06321.1 DUF441 domain-containing protein [Enterococcus mundtii]
MESWLFLGLIMLVAVLAKNQSLMLATGFILLVKFIPASKDFLTWLQGKGINIGVTIITAAIIVPIATGDIGLKDLLDAFKSPMGWVAIFCGGLVAVLSSKGVGLIATDPQITVALVFGTILGVVFLKGIAAGPVIASGIAYCILQLFSFNK